MHPQIYRVVLLSLAVWTLPSLAGAEVPVVLTAARAKQALVKRHGNEVVGCHRLSRRVIDCKEIVRYEAEGINGELSHGWFPCWSRVTLDSRIEVELLRTGPTHEELAQGEDV